MMWPQALTESATDADRTFAALRGGLFVGASWAFGDVVEMANAVMARPGMSGPAMARPEMADPAMETT